MKRGALVVVVGLFAQLAAAQSGSQQRFAPTEPYVDRVRRDGALTELTLKEAIERTLVSNLDIAIEYYNGQLARRRLSGALGAYDPLLSVSTDLTSSEAPTTSVLQGGIASENARGLSFGSVVQQLIPGGGSVIASLTNSRNTTNNAFTFVNPLFGSNLDFSVTQPLWRGFLENVAARQIKEGRLQIEASDAQFRQRVADVVQLAQNQYWTLLGAIETYEARRQSRDLAVQQYERTRQRVQGGLLSGVALTSARAEVAGREQEMIESEVLIIQAQNELKRSLSADARGEIWDRAILPLDRPEIREPTLHLAEAISLALTQRPELEQLRRQVEIAQVNVAFFKNETRPSVDFQAGVGSVGRSGQLSPGLIPPVVGGAPPSALSGIGGFGTAWGQVFRFDYSNWHTGVAARIPLRNRTAQAQFQQAQLTERQLQSQLSKGQQAVVVEVRNAWEGVMTRKKSLDAARLARELSEEQLAAETARFQAGFTTNFEVLRYQRDLADAKVRELRVLIDYQAALTALEKAIGVIVGADDLARARR